MLRNKYIMSVIMCISALAQGAADNADDRGFTGPTTNRLTLADCFDQRATLIPGKQKFYVPIIISTTHTGPLRAKVFGIPVGRENRRIKSCVGFFEGEDEAVTQETANLFLSSFNLESAKTQYESIDISFDFMALKRKVLKSDPTKLEQVMSIKHMLLLIESVPESPTFRIKISGVGTGHLHSFTSSPAALIKAQSKIKQASMLLSGLPDVTLHFDESASLDERNASIAAHAKTVAESHEAMYLVLNNERYEQFKQQEFAPST
jgi:hypothetical protein